MNSEDFNYAREGERNFIHIGDKVEIFDQRKKRLQELTALVLASIHHGYSIDSNSFQATLDKAGLASEEVSSEVRRILESEHQVLLDKLRNFEEGL